MTERHPVEERANRYATMEEVMEIYRQIVIDHDHAFRELAKGPEGVGPHDPPPFDLKKW